MKTKVCKYCQIIISKNTKICPNCGKKQNVIVSRVITVIALFYLIGIISSLNRNEIKNDDLHIEEDSQVIEENNISVNIEEQIIYDARNVKMYVKGIEESEYGYNLNIYIENNSSQNLGFNAHAYSVNKIMTNNNIYSMDCDVAAGKKANAKIEIKANFIELYKIEQIETIDILFWVYDNDKSFKEFDTGQITLETNLYDEKVDRIVGTNIYDENGIKVDYLYNSGNKYTYCLTNDTGMYMDFDVENITINDFTFSEMDYNLIGIIVLNESQSLFTIEVSDDFLFSNDISIIKKVEFTFEIRPVESYSEKWNTDMILLEL